MRRKLVKQGPSTITVSLPSQWVRANKLKPGQEVALSIERNSVIVSCEQDDKEQGIIAVDVRSLTNIIPTLLSALHKKGFDEIQLQCTKEQIPVIQKVVNHHLLGFEIVQQTADNIVIRFVTKIDADELQMLIRRTFLVTLSIAEGALHASEHKELIILEETNNRLTNYCERIIVKNLHHQRDGVFLYLIVWLLEKIADEYKDLITADIHEKQEATLCLELLKEYYELFYKYNHKRFDDYVSKLSDGIQRFRAKQSRYLPVLLLLSQAKASTIALHAQQ
jgi:phosphate uptake regulator